MVFVNTNLVNILQDLNIAQFELLKILSAKHKNLTVIGDCDQNIYSWRGASLDVVMAFSRLPETKLMKLEQNYRCSNVIVQASNEVIKNNRNRLERKLWTSNDPGNKITYFHADTEYEEAEFVGGVIDHLCHRKRTNTYDDFAILYRTNNQSRVLEDVLSQLFIPYQIIGGMSFYDRKEVKDVLAYIRLLVNPHDVMSFQRIANEPKRSIGETTLRRIVDFIYENNLSVTDAIDRADEIEKLGAKAKEALKKLGATIKEYRDLASQLEPSRLIKDYATALGYLDMLEGNDDKDRVLNIYELANIASVWYERTTPEGYAACLEDFVRQLNLISDSDAKTDDKPCVKLMTVHTAKGLEFPVVFMVGMEEGIFPHIMALKSADRDVEEERRLCYVSMTRAKQKLYLTNAEQRRAFGKSVWNQPSRFIREVPNHLIKKV